MQNGKYVSADGHVIEPMDLWQTRLDKRFRDRAPGIDSRPEGDYFLLEGHPPFPVGLEGAMINEKIAGEIKDLGGRRYTDSRPGAWDPQARLADQDLDNLRADVIYPGVGLLILGHPDAEFKRACLRVYNDWLSELCSVAPDRLLGAGLLPLGGPVEWAIEEAERVIKKGLRSVSIPATVKDHPYFFREHDRLWAALEEMNVPVAIHAGTGKWPLFEEFARTFRLEAIGLDLADARMGLPARTIGDLMWGGVPQRYPKLRFVLVETGMGWIASLLEFMDHWWNDHRRWMEPKLEESPSDYFHRQFWVTFEEDRSGIVTRDLLNVDHLMWGSDYPHTEGTFPRSQQQIAHDFVGVPETELRKIVWENAEQLYSIDVA